MIQIEQLAVKNYRSLLDFRLPLSPLTVLIGKNDAGKSNVLRALQILLDDESAKQVDSYDWSKLAKKQRSNRVLEFDAAIESPNRIINIRRHIGLAESNALPQALQILDGGSWRTLTFEEEFLIPSFYYLRPRTGALQEAFDPRNENHIITLIKAWMPPKLRSTPAIHKLMRGYAPNSTNLSAYVKFLQNEIYPSLKLAFPSDFPVIQLNADFRSDEKGRLLVREMTHATAKKANFRLPLDRHGTALISITAMILTIAVLQEYHRQSLRNKPLMIGIEEPEVHLHPQAQRTFLEYLQQESQKVQTILTTHSPLFVDRLHPKNVVVLRRATLHDENKKVARAGITQAIIGDYKENWRSTIDVLGLRLSDVLMAGDVNLVVEGPTESIVLPAIANKLTRDGQLNFSFERIMVTNGKGDQLINLLPFLKATGNPVFVLLDDDKSGRQLRSKIAREHPDMQLLSLPHPLYPPLNRLEYYEFEDLLNPQELLSAFNEAFSGIPGYEFLPIGSDEFAKEQQKLFTSGPEFGWVATIGSIVEQKTSSTKLKDSKLTDRFSKARLAEKVAEHIAVGKFTVPSFFQPLLSQLGVSIGN